MELTIYMYMPGALVHFLSQYQACTCSCSCICRYTYCRLSLVTCMYLFAVNKLIPQLPFMPFLSFHMFSHVNSQAFANNMLKHHEKTGKS